uniref:Antidiuretic factor B n=2 Tax=Tenebrionidae TaxID=7065 RepID=ADFB_TENMO|nr:RecName: Full=Antidiuretic factor B; Short=ADFb [Tenebrio molitor]
YDDGSYKPHIYGF